MANDQPHPFRVAWFSARDQAPELTDAERSTLFPKPPIYSIPAPICFVVIKMSDLKSEGWYVDNYKLQEAVEEEVEGMSKNDLVKLLLDVSFIYQFAV